MLEEWVEFQQILIFILFFLVFLIFQILYRSGIVKGIRVLGILFEIMTIILGILVLASLIGFFVKFVSRKRVEKSGNIR